MLPDDLRGPARKIESEDAEVFIERAVQVYPHLDPDFVSQLCYELPGHLDYVLPDFDPHHCGAFRVTRTAQWVLENLQYFDGRDVFEEWSWHVDLFLIEGRKGSPLLQSMLENRTWSFPPVVVDARTARELGLNSTGDKYFLTEGTHRVSYLSRLVALGRIEHTQLVELIEVRLLSGT